MRMIYKLLTVIVAGLVIMSCLSSKTGSFTNQEIKDDKDIVERVLTLKSSAIPRKTDTESARRYVADIHVVNIIPEEPAAGHGYIRLAESDPRLRHSDSTTARTIWMHDRAGDITAQAVRLWTLRRCLCTARPAVGADGILHGGMTMSQYRWNHNFIFPPKTSKYGARKVDLNGEHYDSAKEFTRHQELKLLQKAGEISDIRRQVKYVLIPKQVDENGKLIERECAYKADFVYKDKDGHEIVEDVKGYTGGSAYAVFTIKRKLMLQLYGIRVQEV